MTAEQTMGSGNAAGGYAPRRIAEIVAGICEGDPEQRISLHELLDLFEVRAFGFLVLVFALPNGIPAPIAPGLSAILGAPLLLLAGQMVLGFQHPWFPQKWLRRSFRRADIAKMLRPAVPWLQKIERYLQPRLQRIAGWRARRLIGAIVLWNAVLLSLPIPFGNLIPAWAIILAALGQIERDGLLVLSALVVSALATGWVGLLLFGGLEIVRKLLGM
jgi:hypothetical protein